MSQKFWSQYFCLGVDNWAKTSFAPKLYPSFASLFSCQPWHSHLLVVLWPPRSEPSLGPKTAYRVVRTCSSANLWQQHCFYQIELFDHPVSWNHQHHQHQHHLVNLHCSTSIWASSFVLIIGATIPQAPASSARLYSRWLFYIELKSSKFCSAGIFKWSLFDQFMPDLISAGVLSATRTIGKQVGNFSSRWTHSNAVRSSSRPEQKYQQWIYVRYHTQWRGLTNS